MILTEQEKAEVEANRAALRGAARRWASGRRRARCRRRRRATARRSPRTRSSIARPFPAAGTGRRSSIAARRCASSTRAARPASACSPGTRAIRSERLNHADTVKVQWTRQLAQGPRAPVRHGPRAAVASSRTPAARMTRWSAAPPPPRNAARYRRRLVPQHPRQFRSRRRQARPRPPRRASLRQPSSRRSASMPQGASTGTASAAAPGDFVDLRAEMDLLVALSNCPHPLDPAPDYAPGAVEIVRYRAPRAARTTISAAPRPPKPCAPSRTTRPICAAEGGR